MIFKIVNLDIITRKRSFMTVKIVFLIIKCLNLEGPMFYHGHKDGIKDFYAVFVRRCPMGWLDYSEFETNA